MAIELGDFKQPRQQDVIRIARINNLRLNEVDYAEIALFCEMELFVGLPMSHIKSKYVTPLAGTPWKYLDPKQKREYIEKIQTFDQAVEAYLDIPMNAHSYGRYLPSYLLFLQYQKEKSNILSDQPYRSLLVGALTADTVNEYQSTVKRVFPNADTMTIDIEGITTTHPGFVYGNGLRMPFRDSSFDSVQTNVLLHQLKSGGNQTVLGMTNFFREAYRVLKPGGHLIMVESNFEEIFGTKNINIAMKIIEGELCTCGFRNNHTTMGRELDSRREVYGMDNLPNEKLVGARTNPYVLAFDVMKPD